MSERDRLIVADAESSVTERARWSGFALDNGSWKYEQVVCPSFPGHLFLRYEKKNGPRDVTVFSASIPRNGDRVRIIPILKRSYSLFAPAPINALTISAFNHIRAEEHGGDIYNWLEDGLCYAALAGAQPVVTPPEAEPTPGKPLAAVTPVLKIAVRGGEEMQFADAAAEPKPTEWTLAFNTQGRLVKVAHTSSPIRVVRPVPAKSPVTKAWTVPGGANR
ncbi:MAG TPA: hypothetical protein VFU68_03805 [Terracidiphilus sp.]|nr:hypothetical protein [Terracidiphilus sp.]